MYNSNFNQEIKSLIDSIISEFKIGLKYFFNSNSSSHFFKIMDQNTWSSDSFQEYKSNKVFELLNNDFYEGIAFFGPNDDTISFDNAAFFEPNEVELFDTIILQDFPQSPVTFSTNITWWVETDEAIDLNTLFDAVSTNIDNIIIYNELSFDIKDDETQDSLKNNLAGNNQHAMAA